MSKGNEQFRLRVQAMFARELAQADSDLAGLLEHGSILGLVAHQEAVRLLEACGAKFPARPVEGPRRRREAQP